MCDTPGRKGRAPEKSPHREIMLELEMLEGKYAPKPKFRVSLNHSDFTVSGWLGCQEGQSWEGKGKAAAAPAELPKEGATAALTQRKERESSSSHGENGRAQGDLGKQCHCQFAQLTQKTLGRAALGAVLLKIEQVLFQQI